MESIKKRNSQAITFIIILIGLVLVSGCTQTETQSEEPTQLSHAKINEICNDARAYANWCYNNGVSVDECSDQIVEKIPRLYGITPAQTSEVLKQC